MSLSGCATFGSDDASLEPGGPKAASRASAKAAKALDWGVQSLPGAIGPLEAVTFADADHGWLVGWDGVILATRDGGRSWQRQESGTDWDLMQVSFVDSHHGWVLGQDDEGENTLVLATTDGGATWETRWHDTDHDGIDMVFVDRRHGWMVAWDDVILASDDGGHSWVEQYSGGEWGALSVAFADRRHGWVVGGRDEGVIMQTTDGGRTWVEWSQRIATLLWDVACVDAEHAWVAGRYAAGRTIDGGATWSARRPTRGATDCEAVVFADKLQGWMVGNEVGGILTSGDGGKTWAKASGTEHHLIDIAVSAGGTVWAVGENGSSPSRRGLLIVGRGRE